MLYASLRDDSKVHPLPNIGSGHREHISKIFLTVKKDHLKSEEMFTNACGISKLGFFLNNYFIT